GSTRFIGIELLDLRDDDVDWSCRAGDFPDLATLVVRPRHKKIGARWVSPILSRPDVFPTLRELRAPEYHADDILEMLLASPLLPQLRGLDFTNGLTNRGAKALYESTVLDHVEELWVATTNQRRREYEKMLSAKRDAVMPPLGDLEITDDWR